MLVPDITSVVPLFFVERIPTPGAAMRCALSAADVAKFEKLANVSSAPKPVAAPVPHGAPSESARAETAMTSSYAAGEMNLMSS